MAQKPHEFARDDRPPRYNPVPRLLRVDANDKGLFAICSVGPQGYWNHWDDGRTFPCLKGPKLCKRCLKKVPRRWMGYLFVSQPNGSGGSFLEITRLGRDDLDKLLGEGESWRGILLHVEREKKSIRSPLVFSKVGGVPLHVKLPMDRDVLPTLKRVWRFEDLD